MTKKAGAAPKKTPVAAAKKLAAAASTHKKEAPAPVTRKAAAPKEPSAKSAPTVTKALSAKETPTAAPKAVTAAKKEAVSPASKKAKKPATAPPKTDVPAKKAAPAKKVAAVKQEPTKKVTAVAKKTKTPAKAEVKETPKATEATKKPAVESKTTEKKEAAEKKVPTKKAAKAKENAVPAAKKGGKKNIEQQLAKLQGNEWDSDDEDVSVRASTATSKKEPEKLNFEANVDFVELTKKTKQNLAQSKGATAASADATATQSSTIFIGRIPHGFYEKQMRGFFSQFGEIKRLKVSRNKKSGKSKHYAFIEFEEPDVARVVADTMDGYRLFDKTLSCNVLPLDKCHERMFIGANRTFRPIPYRKLAIREHNAGKTYEQQEAINARLLAKETIKRNKLKALGIEYEFEGYAGSAPAKSSHVKF
ncbi:hypothetical protein H310_04083 [Aphanomyces invadans]|uniref:RRM domain-containing protein n=1 Tax=Aphanomyces invadans TaxID=157072 RepID=A0A024UHF1_9STRA|nr:hypothetical protein H310_04083 [Aphanomyces invadans]ETW05038.1 hypothetical protein H310_04083 [Aphanomyces invadans]|eukprot:XP_008866476.1 hypothetical protein H310_04083 [Aphanomyces invadans]